MYPKPKPILLYVRASSTVRSVNTKYKSIRRWPLPPQRNLFAWHILQLASLFKSSFKQIITIQTIIVVSVVVCRFSFIHQLSSLYNMCRCTSKHWICCVFPLNSLKCDPFIFNFPLKLLRFKFSITIQVLGC